VLLVGSEAYPWVCFGMSALYAAHVRGKAGAILAWVAGGVPVWSLRSLHMPIYQLAVYKSDMAARVHGHGLCCVTAKGRQGPRAEAALRTAANNCLKTHLSRQGSQMKVTDSTSRVRLSTLCLRALRLKTLPGNLARTQSAP